MGEELERVQAYPDILKIRMGARLNLQIEVAPALKPVLFPTMMLQTLVENAIKHGLEAKPGGGTGIGLRNVRERLRLAYGMPAAACCA